MSSAFGMVFGIYAFKCANGLFLYISLSAAEMASAKLPARYAPPMLIARDTSG